ncbi:MAG: zinc ribbon domain-containing protein [Methanomassiliicoccaceae archaeon]|nr:zinc ribbon domain-containing protein [Methanomassiliicoccaceae archaeon]
MASYCNKCGRQIEDETRFCPSCGNDTMSEGSSNQSSNQNKNTTQGMGGTVTLIFILGILWGILLLISGIILLGFGGYIALFDFLGGAFVLVGILCLVNGIIALICCVNLYKLEKHKRACTLLLIGSILSFFTGGIIAGIVGVIFYFLLKKEDYRFKS